MNGEAVLTLADSSEITILNSVGSRIFELADGTNSIADIVDTVAAEYEVSRPRATSDIKWFIQQMVDQDIFVLTERGEG